MLEFWPEQQMYITVVVVLCNAQAGQRMRRTKLIVIFLLRLSCWAQASSLIPEENSTHAWKWTPGPQPGQDMEEEEEDDV